MGRNINKTEPKNVCVVNIITEEIITLDGKKLVRGEDYTIEATLGILALSKEITEYIRDNNNFTLHSTIDRKLIKYVNPK